MKIVTARSRSQDPAQEALREHKSQWNARVSKLIPVLIEFKRAVNGHPVPAIGVDKGSIKDPLPESVVTLSKQLQDLFTEVFNDVQKIIQEQEAYSANRRKPQEYTQIPAAATYKPVLVKNAGLLSLIWNHVRSPFLFDEEDRWLRKDILQTADELEDLLNQIQKAILNQEENAIPTAVYLVKDFVQLLTHSIIEPLVEWNEAQEEPPKKEEEPSKKEESPNIEEEIYKIKEELRYPLKLQQLEKLKEKKEKLERQKEVDLVEEEIKLLKDRLKGPQNEEKLKKLREKEKRLKEGPAPKDVLDEELQQLKEELKDPLKREKIEKLKEKKEKLSDPLEAEIKELQKELKGPLRKEKIDQLKDKLEELKQKYPDIDVEDMIEFLSSETGEFSEISGSALDLQQMRADLFDKMGYIESTIKPSINQLQLTDELREAFQQATSGFNSATLKFTIEGASEEQMLNAYNEAIEFYNAIIELANRLNAIQAMSFNELVKYAAEVGNWFKRRWLDIVSGKDRPIRVRIDDDLNKAKDQLENFANAVLSKKSQLGKIFLELSAFNKILKSILESMVRLADMHNNQVRREQATARRFQEKVYSQLIPATEINMLRNAIKDLDKLEQSVNQSLTG